MHSRYLEGEQKLRMDTKQCMEYLVCPELGFLMFPFQRSGARTGRQAESITAGTPGEDGSRRWEQKTSCRLYVCISSLVYADKLGFFYTSVDHLKTDEELSEEKRILNEMLEVVEQRDSLVALLEEQRLREKEEDKDLEEVMLSKGFSLNWSWD